MTVIEFVGEAKEESRVGREEIETVQLLLLAKEQVDLVDEECQRMEEKELDEVASRAGEEEEHDEESLALHLALIVTFAKW